MISSGKSDMHDQGQARSNLEWYETPLGCYVKERKKRLILDLTSPIKGESVLGVGQGIHENLLIFKDKGCTVTGIEQLPWKEARSTCSLEGNAFIYPGEATDLPFSDDQFDVVALVGALEFTEDPQRAISEAIRVCRDRVLLSVTNKYPFTSAHNRPPGYDHARPFYLTGLRGMVINQLERASIQWGSVLFLPFGWYRYRFAAVLEEAIPVMKNPFGAFFGLSFPVKYTYRTVQEPLSDAFHFRAKAGKPVPGAIRGGTAWTRQ